MTDEFEIIDHLEIYLADSACRREFKIDADRKSGMGEKRLFIRNTKRREQLDNFFELDRIEFFCYRKEDLLDYLKKSEDEYLHPTQKYQNNITQYYEELCQQTMSLQNEYYEMKFQVTYDEQHRYYLVLEGSISKNNKYRLAYSYLNDICLPRLTKIHFIKVRNCSNGKLYIHMMPIFTTDKEKLSRLDVENIGDNLSNNELTFARDEDEFEELVYNAAPFCAICGTTYKEILEICRIKPLGECEDSEMYDIYNGIVLTPTYHKLLNNGLISFTNDGLLLVSSMITETTREKLGIEEGKICFRIDPRRNKYLEYHRNYIFKNF